MPAGTPVLETLVSEHQIELVSSQQTTSSSLLCNIAAIIAAEAVNKAKHYQKSEPQHYVQPKHSTSDCMFICRTCLPDLGGTGGAPPYGTPSQKHTCPLLISSSQFLCMMARKTVPLHPCQAWIGWVGGMVSSTQSKKPGLMASTKSSFSLRCGFLSCVHLNSLLLCKHSCQAWTPVAAVSWNSRNACFSICCLCLLS